MAKFEEPPVVPLENTNDVVHRRQLAMRANAAAVSRDGVGRLLYPITDNEESAGVTPVNFYYPPGDVRRYGIEPTQGRLIGDAGVTVNLYVDPDNGDDSNSGSEESPFKTPQKACSAIGQHPSIIRDCVITLKAGTYDEGIFIPAGTRIRGEITIQGPSVSNTPGNSVDISFDEENASGTFSDGETVTGGTSGAEGTIEEVGTRYIVVAITSGSFEAEETLTGGTSSATCVVRGIRPVPTAIIDGTTANRTVGILGEDRQNVRIKNIKVQNFDGPGDSGVRFSDHSTVVLENVHCDNCYNGWFMLDFVSYSAIGGLVNGGEHGIQELFHVVRNMKTVDSLDKGTLVRGATYGIFAKEHCTGHFDHVTLDGNTYGVFFSRSCTANATSARITNNNYGAVLRHGSFLVPLRTDWGLGVDDANTVSWLVDHSSAFTVNENSVEDKFAAQGERQIGYYAPASPTAHTGTTAETSLFELGKIKAGAFTMAGTYLRGIICGIKTGTAGTAVVRLQVGTGNAVGVTLPANAGTFRVDAILASLGPSSQRAHAIGVSTGGVVASTGTRTFVLESGSNKTVSVECALADSADSVTIYTAWLYTTDALAGDT